MTERRDQPPEGFEWMFSRYITRNGRRIRHPNGGVYRFPVKSRRSRK